MTLPTFENPQCRHAFSSLSSILGWPTFACEAHHIGNDWILGHCSRISGVQLQADSLDDADCVHICIVFLLIKYLASGPTGRRLRASALLRSHVFLYSMVYWYWLSVRAHRASLLATKAGVALVGPNNTRRGLWSVTRINQQP